jgi:putative ABC transport system permease protein
MARASARWLGTVLHDAALAARRLVRAAVFVTVTTATLTLGLAMFAVAYTTVDKVLFEPMPYRNPDDLYFVWRDYGPIRDQTRGGLAGTDVVDLQNAGGVIESAVALQPFLGGVFSPGESDDAMEISVIVTSPSLFEVLGVQPALGRTFAADDAGPGATLTMVLTHELWNRLGAEPDVIGKEVRLNGRPHVVIGVLPQDFDFVRNDADGLPQRADAYSTLRINLSDPSPNLADYSALIRARPGTPPRAVATAVDAVGRVVDAREFDSRGLTLYPVALQADLVARARPALLMLGSAGAVLALMLTLNLASVLLARAAEREHEFGVCRALGASRSTIARNVLLEGGLLGLVGGSLGAVIGTWGTRTLVALAPLDLPRREAIMLDWYSASVVLGVGLVIGLMAATVAALWATRSWRSSPLSSAARSGHGRARLRRGMIVAQVALSLVLLNTGALVVRSYEQLLAADPGFEPEDVLSVLVRTPPVFFANSEVIAFQDEVSDALASVPGVTRVSATTALPLTATTTFRPRTIEIPDAPGNTGDPEHDAVLTDVIGARGGYTDVMGMRVVAGRAFEESRSTPMIEALVDTTFARHFFPGVNPIGARIPQGDSELTIVGVVEQARLYDIYQDGRPQIYVRMNEEWFYRPLFYVMATTRDPDALLPEIRAAVRRVDARVAVGEMRTMTEIVADTLRQQRTGAVLIGTLALGALALVSMGIFGVVAAAVTRRHHELAVRLAIGADQRNVLRLVVGEAAVLVVAGVFVGVPGIYAATSLLRGALVGISSTDMLAVVGAPLGLAFITLATAYVAARRALKIEPVRLLQKD